MFRFLKIGIAAYLCFSSLSLFRVPVNALPAVETSLISNDGFSEVFPGIEPGPEQGTIIPISEVHLLTADVFGLPARNRRSSEFYVLRAYWKGVPKTLEVDVHGLPEKVTFVRENADIVAAWEENGQSHRTPVISAANLAAQGIREGSTFKIHAGLDFQSRNEQGEKENLSFHPGFAGTVKIYPNSKTNTIGVIPDFNRKIVIQFLHADHPLVTEGQHVSWNTPLGVTGTKGAGALHLHIQARSVLTNELLDPDEVIAPLAKPSGIVGDGMTHDASGLWRIQGFTTGKTIRIERTSAGYEVRDGIPFVLQGEARTLTGEHIFTIPELEQRAGQAIPTNVRTNLEGRVRAHLTLTLSEDGQSAIYYFEGAGWSADEKTGKVSITPPRRPQKLSLTRVTAH